MAHIDERRDACRVLVGKPEGRRPLGRHVHRWNIVWKRICMNQDGAID